MDHGNMGFPTSSIFFEAFLGETGIHLGDDDLVPCKVGRTGRSTRKEFSRPQKRLTLLKSNTSPNKASNIESMIFRTSRFFLGYDMDMYGFRMFQGTGTRINRHFLLIRSTQVLCEASAALVKKRGIKLPPGPDVGCYQNAAGDPAISGRLWRPWKVSKMAGKVGLSDYIVTHVYFMGGLKGRYEMRMNNVL